MINYSKISWLYVKALLIVLFINTAGASFGQLGNGSTDKNKKLFWYILLSADKPLTNVAFWLGPFKNKPGNKTVMVNGRFPKTTLQKSGDSWWARCTTFIEQNQ